jgi:NTP pyrophosphatase (non-canonical NTP hydrolase)
MTYPLLITHHADVHGLVDDEVHRQLEMKRTGRFRYVCSDEEMGAEECLAVLMEEVGEVARAILEHKRLANDTHNKDIKKELIQVAAAAIAWASKT